jgi:hypothetical protein
VPIPPFSINGVLPPYVGASGPGGPAQDMSPYVVTALEVVSTLGRTDPRKRILRGWLNHRQALRTLGFNRGFQWLDGSFVEDKDPNDIDVVTFIFRPATIPNLPSLRALMQAHGQVFIPAQAKAAYMVDAYFIDLDGPPESIVDGTRYFLGLFSHRRNDEIWKGILQIRMEDVADDAAALAALGMAASGGSAP